MLEFNWTKFYLIFLLIGVLVMFALIIAVGNSSVIILAPEKVELLIPSLKGLFI